MAVAASARIIGGSCGAMGILPRSQFHMYLRIASMHGVTTRCEKKVKVRLRIDHQVQFGESHAILGSAPCIGAWQDRVPLQWSESGWVVEFEAEPHETFEYKHVIVTESGDIIWEGGPNRVLSMPSTGKFEVVTHWDSTYEDLELKQPQETIPTFVQRWQRRPEEVPQWNFAGLDGPALQIVEGDKSGSNWWQKLDLVRVLLTDKKRTQDRLRTLVHIAVYLKWIATGNIPCREDGRERHGLQKAAETSRQIFVELERLPDVTLRELVVIRKIHTCLPSFNTAGIQVLHDIPDDITQEIHELQTKVHNRSAGPEDLVTTEALLARVMKTKNRAFISQFKTFHWELKHFFNAGSLSEQLETLRPTIDRDYHAILEHFLCSEERLETLETSNIIEPLLDTIHALNNLRKVLSRRLESGLGDTIDTRQKWRIAELGLEEYSFLLLSRIVNAFDERGGAAWLGEEGRNGKVALWTPALTSLAMGIQQLGVSDLQVR